MISSANGYTPARALAMISIDSAAITNGIRSAAGGHLHCTARTLRVFLPTLCGVCRAEISGRKKAGAGNVVGVEPARNSASILGCVGRSVVFCCNLGLFTSNTMGCFVFLQAAGRFFWARPSL
jgi:hypothetical protein